MDKIVERLRRDVEALCQRPRHRSVKGSMEAARAYCVGELTHAGWSVEERPFRPRPWFRMSDAGHPWSPLVRKWEGRLHGVNVLATPPGVTGPEVGDTLLLAHLDTVKRSVGADDNASGVAVVLEVARQLQGASGRGVVLGLVDFEELVHLGSRVLATTLPTPGLVVCLDAVGFFDDRAGSQRVPGALGASFSEPARQIKAGDRRGDFLLAVHRDSSAGFVRTWQVAADSAGLRTVAVRDPRWDGAGQRVTRWLYPWLFDLDRSDHAQFWRRQIPAVLLTDTALGRSSHYHRASDTPQTLDYDRLSLVATSLASSLGVAS